MNDVQKLLNAYNALEDEMKKFSRLAGDVLHSIEAREFVSEKINTDMMQCVMEFNRKQKEVFKLYQSAGLGEAAPKKMQEMRDQIEQGLADREQLDYLEAVRKSFQSLYTENPEVDKALQTFKDKVDTIRVEKYPLDKCLVYIRPFAVFLTVIKSNDPEKTLELIPILSDYFGSKLVAHVTVSKDIHIGDEATEFTMEEEIPEDSADQAELPEDKKASPQESAAPAAAKIAEAETEAVAAEEATAGATAGAVAEPVAAEATAVAVAEPVAAETVEEIAEPIVAEPVMADATAEAVAEVEEPEAEAIVTEAVEAEEPGETTAEAVAEAVTEAAPEESVSETVSEENGILLETEEPEAATAGVVAEEPEEATAGATAGAVAEAVPEEPISMNTIEGDDMMLDLLASDAEKREEREEEYAKYAEEQKKMEELDAELLQADVKPAELDPDALGTIELEPLEPELKEDELPEANVLNFEDLQEVSRPAKPTKPKKVDLKALLEEDTFSESKLNDPELDDMNSGRKKKRKGGKKESGGLFSPKGIIGGF